MTIEVDDDGDDGGADHSYSSQCGTTYRIPCFCFIWPLLIPDGTNNKYFTVSPQNTNTTVDRSRQDS